MSERKPILHFRIPINKSGNLALKQDLILKFGEIIQSHLGDSYDIIFSPFEVFVENGGDIVSVKVGEESLNKFLKESM